MAKLTAEVTARPAAAAKTASFSARRPPRASVPAFGGWEVAGGVAAADYSLDFTNIRAARMMQRRKALSWSSFVGNNAAVVAEAEAPGGGDGGHEEKRQWSSASASDGDDDDERRRRRHRQQHRRLRSDDIDHERLPIQPRRAAPKVS